MCLLFKVFGCLIVCKCINRVIKKNENKNMNWCKLKKDFKNKI